MLKYIILLTCSTLSLFLSENPKDAAANAYVEKYKDLAIVEMHRSGIPASITLAQALHESGIGDSDLAIFANNHFGIKCKSYWKGQTYNHKDDDFDESGNLIKSCFRSYESVIDSYVDHSNFLTQSAHYSELFNYDKTDYKRWAFGLKNCGYATDPEYAFKIINKIEKYQLNMYDSYRNPMVAE
ncbi:MAG: flagellum-specific peptidoglycan hydrolase FlgJ [Saprospiraceae bacterium]|jgi:flagellum-specific peptidoglycan hydrolase FlgJ|tara:strand:- start:428 stop:979 length:552 start_codon:yes stop_codon:yes gene_type:complete